MELLLRILANSSIDDVERMCKKFGVDIKNDDGSYKAINIVFYELSEVYSNLKR